MSGILMRIRSTYDDGARETEHGLIQRIAEVPVLVLDDLGKERLTDWSAQMLWEIANARYERGNPVVITTNCGLDALLQRYAQRIKGVDEFTLPAMMERLVEMSGDWIEVRGESRRWLRSAHGGAA